MRNKVLLSRRFTLFHFFVFMYVDKIYVISKGRVASSVLRLLKKLNLMDFTLKALKVEFLKDGLSIGGYPSLEATSREKISQIVYEYFPDSINALDTLLDAKGAESFYIKGMCYHSEIASFYKAYTILIEYYLEDDENILTLFPSTASKVLKLRTLITHNGLMNLINYFYKFLLYFKIYSLYFFRSSKQEKLQKEYEFASEISNPKFFGHKFAEPNYLNEESCLYYLTSQKNMEEVDVSSFGRSYDFIDLKNVGISKSLLQKFKNTISSQQVCDYEIYKLYLKLFETYTQYTFLFENYKIKYNIFLQFSNDKRYVRMDSGIVTSLAKQYGVKNISYQTRTPYLNDYTFYYDYFHIFFEWSEYWYDVGCLAKNFEQIYTAGIDTNKNDAKKKKNQITIFTSDIANGTHNTKSYNIHMIEIAKKLAAKYTDFEFIIKTKFEEQSKKEFEHIKLYENMKYAFGTYDLDELIDNSCIVIAMGFTSPGFQALIKGVNTIYYSELTGIQNKASDFEFVATNHHEVEILFEKYLKREIDLSPYAHLLNAKQGNGHRDTILKCIKMGTK